MLPTLDVLDRTDPVRVETKVLDAREGVVRALVGVTGNLDEQRDIIIPGAFTYGLNWVTPKGVWSHDWDRPIAKTIEAVEVMPGDKSLPGDLLAAGYGALRVDMQFFLGPDTPSSREAFAIVRAFGDEQQWSIGYRVPEGGAATIYDGVSSAEAAALVAPELLDRVPQIVKQATEDGDPVRLISQIIVYEYSPVLHGANRLTRTEKSAVADALATLAAKIDHVEELAAKIEAAVARLTDHDGTTGGDRIRELEDAVNFFAAEYRGSEMRAAAARVIDALTLLVDGDTTDPTSDDDVGPVERDGDTAATHRISAAEQFELAHLRSLI